MRGEKVLFSRLYREKVAAFPAMVSDICDMRHRQLIPAAAKP